MAGRDQGRRPAANRMGRGGIIVHMDEEKVVSDAMLEGWARWQCARGVSQKVARQRNSAVRRFVSDTNEYPCIGRLVISTSGLSIW